MSSYNHEDYISEAIESVLCQSHRDFELIIVDDCSNDRTAKIIETFMSRDHRIRLVSHEENLGMARTYNDGLEAAQGKFVAIINSDDIWESTKLEKQLSVLQKGDELVVWSEGAVIDKDGILTGDKFTQLQGDFQTKKSGDILEELLNGNFILNSSIIFTNALVSDISFDEKLKYLNDHRFMIALAEKTKFHFVKTPLVKYRIHGRNSILSNMEDWQRDELTLSQQLIEEFGHRISKKTKSNILFRAGRACSRVDQRKRAQHFLLGAIKNDLFSKRNILCLAIAFGAEDTQTGQAFIDFYYADSFFQRILGKNTSPLWWWRAPPHRFYPPRRTL